MPRTVTDMQDQAAELRVQRVLESRRRANASGQEGPDAATIRTAFLAGRTSEMSTKRSTPCQHQT